MESLSIQLQPFFEWLLRTTLQASLLICLILLLQTMLRGRLGIRWHYCLWLLLLVRMALPWSPQSRASIFNLIPKSIPQRQTEYAAEPVEDESSKTEVTSAGTGKSMPASTTKVAQDSPDAVTVTPRISEEAKGWSKPAFSELADILPLVWLAGALVLGVYICANNFALLRIVRRERPLTDQKILDLLEDCKAEMGIRIILGVVPTKKVNSASLFGFVRPRLLLPDGMIETLSREELRYVFLHELAHLKRHDIYVGWLMSLLQVLHWFNPLIWLAFYRMRADRELACDALVLARTRSDEPKIYGRIIVGLLERFSRSQRLPAMAGILETKAQLKRRITMIARFKKNSYQWSPLAVILIIILACVSLPDAKHTKASEASASKPSGIVVRQVWTDAADPRFLGAPSPDGKYLSYVDWETGDLAVHELVTGKNRRLTNEGRSKGLVSNSVFSPDSRQIAYHWWDYEKKSSQLRILGLDGSGPRVFNQDKETSIYSRGIYPTGWTPDGKHILALGRKGDRSLEILLVPVADEPVRILKTLGKKLPGGPRIPGLCLSPDGRYVAYTFLLSEESVNRDISVVATDGSHEIPLEKHPADDFVLGWAPDGKRVVFASDRTGSMGIWAVEVAEGKTQGTPQLLKPEIGRFHPLGLTQSGSFYYGVYSGGNNVYTAMFDPQKVNLAAKPIIAVHRYEGSNWAPDWSPDGRYLACVSAGPGASPVFLIHSVETGEVRELSPDLKTFNVHSLRWSADGRSLLGAGSTANGPWGALQIDVKTGKVTTVIEGPGIVGPEWAEDGKAVFYVCNLKTNGQIVRHNCATGEKKELYSAQGFISALALSPDGLQLAFHDIQGGALKVLPATGGQPRELVKVEGKITIAWTPDGRQLVYGLRGLGEGPGQLWRIPTEGGESQKLDLEIPYLDHIRFHPDGRQITFTGESQKEKVEVWVMENFLPGVAAAKPEVGAAGDVQQTGLVVREVKIEQGEYGLSLSRDGKRLVYPKRKDGKTNLVVRDLASGEETQITNYETGTAEYPVFSPDGKEVVYTHQLDTIHLHIVSLETGEDRQLDQDGWAYDWSRDGRFLLLWGNKVLPLGGGNVKQLNLPKGRPAGRFSPDGKYVTYSRQGNIYLYPVDGGYPIQITDGSAPSGQPIWSPNGKVLLFLSQRAFGPEMDLCGVSVVDGKAADDVQVIKPDFGDNVKLISLSETGRLLFRRSHMGVHLDVTPIDPQTGQPSGKPVRLADGYWPMWSPDGKRIAYFSGGALHVMSADGSNDQKIIRVQPFTGTHAWAADNKHIYVAESSRTAERKGVYSISIATRERRPVYLDPDLIGHLSCSPDGRRLAFLKRSAASKKYEVFTVGVDGKNLQQLTSNKDMTVYYPAWSPDGKQIAFESGPGGGIKTLTVVSVDDGTSREVFRGKTPQDRFFEASWSPDGSKIAWQTYTLGGIRIGQVSDGKYDEFKVNLGTLTKPELKTPRWSPDGTKILFCTYSEVQHLMLMDNFLPQSDEAK